jgi:hypothetical protein
MTSRPDNQIIIDMLTATLGNLTETAKRLHVSRTTLYAWFKDDPSLKEAREEVDESNLDFAETQLMRLMRGFPKMEDVKDAEGNVTGQKQVGWITEPNPSSIYFFLKCKGKKRGYIEKSEVDFRGEIAPLVFKFPLAGDNGGNGDKKKEDIVIGDLKLIMPKEANPITQANPKVDNALE